MENRIGRQAVAKACYGHLGGKLGDMLFERLIALGWFKPVEGESRAYEITDQGYRELARLGVDVSQFQRKK